MSDTRPDLPEFERPPVSEVALSIQFEPISDFRIAHVGLLWRALREKYPLTQEQATIDPTIERFDKKPEEQAQGVQFQLLTRPPVRVWFLTADQSRIVQVQHDRFVRNWRGDGEHYPRYERLRDDLKEDYVTFKSFLDQEKLGIPRTTQGEITYVNQIVADETWDSHGDAHKVFQVCSLPTAEKEPALEDFGFALRYVIPDKKGTPVGRLYVTVGSAFRKTDEKPVFVMKLIARGRLNEEGEGAVFGFHELGREWIVRRFAALTTPEMHRIWGREK